MHDPATPEARTTEVPAADAQAREMPAAEVPAAEVPAAEVPDEIPDETPARETPAVGAPAVEGGLAAQEAPRAVALHTVAGTVGEVSVPWARSARVVRWRERSAVVDLAVGVVEGWTVHRTGRGGALLAYYGFISVFPLLMVMTATLGFVLDDRPDLQEDIVDSALAKLPIIGPQIELDATALTGSIVAFVIGLLTALWAGTKAFVGAQTSIDDIWELPFHRQPNLVVRRVRALGMVLVVGIAQVGSAFVTAIAGAADIDALSRISLLIGAFLINLTTLSVAYQVLSTKPLTWRRQILPGAVVAALAFSVLQYLGTVVVARAIERASSVYGAFATVIALLSWLSLHGSATLGGVELNAALHRRRTAQSGTVDPPPVAP